MTADLRDRMAYALAQAIYKRPDPSWCLLEVCHPYADAVLAEIAPTLAEVERLTAALAAVDQDAKEARMERDEAKAKAEPLDRWADIHATVSKHRDSGMTDNELTDAIWAHIAGGAL